MTAEERLVKEHRVRRMAQEKAQRKDWEATGLLAECSRQEEQINARHDIAELGITDKLRTGKKPLISLTYITSSVTIISQALGRGPDARRTPPTLLMANI